MKRLLINMGFHGIRHKIAAEKLIQWMHENGLGA
jgi:hypothetical protein